ncbi:MAG: imidazole glycerol phosphate synthase subunit HisF [Acidobacteria bacterium]|nr:imidazole glycerol phosphate synthase subunit HisF [Acidobacteriota bacterium]
MLAKRIIPCLDVKDGRTVKGTRFKDLRDAGDPAELARIYCEQKADELVFLDITATNEKRRVLVDLVSKVAAAIDIPFTVGGGINSVDDIGLLLGAGADKVSINSAALDDPKVLADAAKCFGSQCVVLAIDAKRSGNGWHAYKNGGRTSAGVDAIEWASMGTSFGAGEILLTSIDADGAKKGFDLELYRSVASAVSVPVIASGGAGTKDHFLEIFQECDADAALAATVFHFKEIEVPALKQWLNARGVAVRM